MIARFTAMQSPDSRIISHDPSLPIRNTIANAIWSVGSANLTPAPEGYRAGKMDVVII